MTEAHVPPRAVGNGGPQRERALWEATDSGARLSGWKPGGLSVFGLCSDCNNLTSGKADPAYVDFHNEVLRYWSPIMRQLLPKPTEVPATVAPSLVARSVLAAMFAINDHLQEHFPDLARGLREDSPDLHLPDDLVLRLALTTGTRSRIGGPVGYMKVLDYRTFYLPFADIWFPPLVWCLRSARSTDQSLGPDFTESWGDASPWIRYDQNVRRDLRELVGALPVTWLPMFGADEWVLLTSDEAMTALEGRPRV